MCTFHTHFLLLQSNHKKIPLNLIYTIWWRPMPMFLFVCFFICVFARSWRALGELLCSFLSILLLPPWLFKWSLFSIHEGSYKQEYSSRPSKLLIPGENPLSLSLSVRVFSDPVNACVPLVDLEDHTGVRPPPWWSQTTRDVAAVEGTSRKTTTTWNKCRWIKELERWGGRSSWCE